MQLVHDDRHVARVHADSLRQLREALRPRGQAQQCLDPASAAAETERLSSSARSWLRTKPDMIPHIELARPGSAAEASAPGSSEAERL